MTRVINLNQIVIDPVIIQFGSLEIDVTKIPSYYSFQMIQFAENQKLGTANPSDALSIVLGAVKSVIPDISDEDILKQGTAPQFVGLVMAMAHEFLKTYDLKDENGPLEKIKGVVMMK